MTTVERTARHGQPLPDGVVTRAATEDDLAACAVIWRDAINDYIVPMNQPPIAEDTGPLTRLHAHIRSTDPERFRVAVRDDAIVGFGAATRRDDVWFLSMLFVRPGEQAAGLGRALLEELLPPADDEATLATATDAVQPISNALYSSYGIVPRTPLLGITGRPERPGAFPDLPPSTTAVPFSTLASEDGGHARLAEAVDALDREVAGFSHPQDHRWLRAEGRLGFLYRDASGAVLGYGYGAPSGRLGPIAVVDDALVPAVLGHLTSAIDVRGAFALWTPGLNDRAVVTMLAAGFRLDTYPLLLCWSRAFGDLRRYLPISPGLL